MYRWLLHRLASWVAKHRKLSLGLVLGYIVLSFFELLPPVEIVSDFIVILGYASILGYIRSRRKAGEPID